MKDSKWSRKDIWCWFLSLCPTTNLLF